MKLHHQLHLLESTQLFSSRCGNYALRKSRTGCYQLWDHSKWLSDLHWSGSQPSSADFELWLELGTPASAANKPLSSAQLQQLHDQRGGIWTSASIAEEVLVPGAFAQRVAPLLSQTASGGRKSQRCAKRRSVADLVVGKSQHLDADDQLPENHIDLFSNTC